ncbi:hypothetical protein [Emticicia fontis]
MQNSVRAKFKVNSLEHLEGGNKKVKLSAIYGKEGENADFTKYTPCGNTDMMITPETPANEYFEPGDEVYVDFTKVAKE